MLNILIGAVIFGYVTYIIWKVPKKQAIGKCAACELRQACTAVECCDQDEDAKTK
ncbi:MAG: FeoB-associated Cys-rich membrane protein [Bacillus sp. (in: firmicutes)]